MLSNSNGTSTSFSIPASVQSQVKITATATTSTGACELSGNYIFAGTYVPQRLTYAPNPVSTELTVTDPETDLTGVSTEPFEVELYDTYGKRVKVKKSEHNRAVLDVRDLPNGLYNLRSGKGKNIVSEHIQITH